MTRHGRLPRVALLFAAPLLAACGAMRAAPPPLPAVAPLAGTTWRLSSLQGRPPPAGIAATLRVEGERISGSDGCNRFAGPVAIRGTSLRIGPDLAATRMACPEPQQALAAAFGQVMTRTVSYRIDGTTLVLIGDGGAALASLDAQPAGLAGTAWRIVGYNTGRQSVVGVDAESRLTLEFGAEGSVRGSSGCNTYSGPWTEAAGGLRIGPLRTTRMACDTPAGAMEREAAFLAALQSTATARREGDRLELRTSTGATAVSAVAASGR